MARDPPVQMALANQFPPGDGKSQQHQAGGRQRERCHQRSARRHLVLWPPSAARTIPTSAAKFPMVK